MSNKNIPTSPRHKTGKRPYEQSKWSLGWQKAKENFIQQSPSIMKYHNQSAFVLQDKFTANEANKKTEMRMTKTNEFNSKLPTYDPRNGHRTNIVFGDQKPSGLSSPRMLSPRMPPGGKSNIIFG